jgi:hypothetical protein
MDHELTNEERDAERKQMKTAHDIYVAKRIAWMFFVPCAMVTVLGALWSSLPTGLSVGLVFATIGASVGNAMVTWIVSGLE